MRNDGNVDEKTRDDMEIETGDKKQRKRRK